MIRNLFKKTLKILNKIKGYLLVIPFIVLLYYSSVENNKLNIEKTILNDTIKSQNVKQDSLILEYNKVKGELDSIRNANEELIKKNDLFIFFREMAFKESSCDQFEVNRYGMMGLYQFNPTTLDFLGLDSNKTNYLNSVELQNEAMISYLKFNKKVLRSYINNYSGKYHKGVYITVSGLLAGAHLTGAGGVMEFFDGKGKYNEYDGNDIHVSEYIEEFSGYDILCYL